MSKAEPQTDTAADLCRAVRTVEDAAERVGAHERALRRAQLDHADAQAVLGRLVRDELRRRALDPEAWTLAINPVAGTVDVKETAK